MLMVNDAMAGKLNRLVDQPGQDAVCLMDGQKTPWDMAHTHLAHLQPVEILDLLHDMSRIWEVAHVFHAEGSNATLNSARERFYPAHKLLDEIAWPIAA